MNAFEERVRALLALPDEELHRPLWDFPPADRNAVLTARIRRRYARWKQSAAEGEVFRPGADWERATGYAPTE